MRMRTWYIIGTALLSLLTIAVVAATLTIQQRQERLDQQELIANSIQRDAIELGYLANDYLLSPRIQERARWEDKIAELEADLASLELTAAEDQALAQSIAANLEAVQAALLAAAPGTPASGSWSRVQAHNQGIIMDAVILYQRTHTIEQGLRKVSIWLGQGIILVFWATLLVNYYFTYRRTLRPLARLRDGVAVVASGDLSHTIAVERADEIGELCHAFNDMTASLRASTASKAELEREVEERRRAQEEAQSLARFPAENPSAVLRIGAGGELLYANKASHDLLEGWPLEVGAPAPAVLQTLSAEACAGPSGRTVDVREGERIIELVAACIAEAGYVNIYGTDITERAEAEEALRQARDELERRVGERTRDLAEANQALTREIEVRRRAELAAQAERQQLNRLMDALPIYLILLTPDYQPVFANRFFRERFGESGGRRCYEHLFGRDKPCEICETYKVLETMAPLQWEWTGPDGRIYYVFDYPFVDTDGSTLIMETGIDITEQRRALNALIQAEKLTATGRMAAVLAHEINNPMQSILGCVGLAREMLAQGGDADKYLSVVSQEIKRVSSLVNEMRDAYRQGSEQRRVVDVDDLLQSALRVTAPQAKAAGVEVAVAAEGGRLAISAAPDRIQQVFLNLILNAVEAMPQGGQLDIRLQATSPDPGVQLAFADTGTGIPEHVLRNLFDPFLTTKDYGTGLGLFASKVIIDQHGGRISVQTEEGKGTTFTLWFPAAGADAAAERAAPSGGA